MSTNEKVSSADTWRETQDLLRDCTTSVQVLELMRQETIGLNRPLWITRMKGRYRVLKTAENDAELEAKLKQYRR